MEDFVVRGSGDNIVLERMDSSGKSTSARPATAEEKYMYDKLIEQSMAVDTWQQVDVQHHIERDALLAEKEKLADLLDRTQKKLAKYEDQVHRLFQVTDDESGSILWWKPDGPYRTDTVNDIKRVVPVDVIRAVFQA
jgi:hypothetical protein